MKLLTLRLLKVHSVKSIIESGAFGVLQNYNAQNASICVKQFRKYSSQIQGVPRIQTSDRFRYQYELSELVDKLKSLSTCDVITSINDVHVDKLLDFLNTQTIESKDDVQAIITSLILAAKLGQNVESIVDKNVLQRFLEHSNACIDQMTTDDVVSALIALHLMKVPLHHNVNRNLTISVSRMLRGKLTKVATLRTFSNLFFENDTMICISLDLHEFPLQSLSNLAIYSRENEISLFPYLFCANGTSHILKYLSETETLQELVYVTLYLENLQMLLTRDIMTEHKTKMKDLLNGIDAKTNLNELFTVFYY